MALVGGSPVPAPARPLAVLVRAARGDVCVSTGGLGHGPPQTVLHSQPFLLGRITAQDIHTAVWITLHRCWGSTASECRLQLSMRGSGCGTPLTWTPVA